MTHDEFMARLRAEVAKAHDDLAFNGNINGVELRKEDAEINVEWKSVLDKAFNLISDFAEKHNMEGLY